VRKPPLGSQRVDHLSACRRALLLSATASRTSQHYRGDQDGGQAVRRSVGQPHQQKGRLSPRAWSPPSLSLARHALHVAMSRARQTLWLGTTTATPQRRHDQVARRRLSRGSCAVASRAHPRDGATRPRRPQPSRWRHTDAFALTAARRAPMRSGQPVCRRPGLACQGAPMRLSTGCPQAHARGSRRLSGAEQLSACSSA
jgi:hypothetical protein